MKSWSTIRRIAHAGLMLYVVSILFAFSIVIVACAGDPILTVLTMPFGIGLGALNAWRADRYVREDRRMLSVLCGVIPPLVVASCFTFAFGITPPLGSDKVPRSSPVIWAEATLANTTKRRTHEF